MDQLPTDQQEALRKIMAAKTYDVGDDELETMDRTALLDVIATDIVAEIRKVRPSRGDGVAAGVEKNGAREQENRGRK